MLWIGTRGSKADWSRLKLSWGCTSLGVMLDGLAWKIGTSGRRRRALWQARFVLRSEGLPSSPQLVVRAPENYLVGACKNLIRKQALASSHWPLSVRLWILRKTKVACAKAWTFRDDANQARIAKEAKLHKRQFVKRK